MSTLWAHTGAIGCIVLFVVLKCYYTCILMGVRVTNVCGIVCRRMDMACTCTVVHYQHSCLLYNPRLAMSASWPQVMRMVILPLAFK